jgi:hypothetical protein
VRTDLGFRVRAPQIMPLEKRLMLDASLPAISGQVLWLDANDTSTILDAEGDNAASGAAFSGSVQTWRDKSASGFDVTAAAATNRPSYTTAALNGRNLVTFDGSTDFLRNTGAVIGGDDYTAFIVFNRTTATGRDAAYELGNGAGSRNALFINNSGGRVDMYHNTAFHAPSTTYTTSSYLLSAVTVNTTAYTLHQNGTSVGSGTVSAARTSSTAIFVGNDASGGDELQGNIAEFIVYDRDLTALERHDVENYLASKWGLTVTNSAPTVATNTGTTLAGGATTTITNAMLNSTDSDNTASSLIYTVTDSVDRGTLFRDADSDSIIDAGETLSLSSTFTQGDINSGLIKYTHDGSITTSDVFSFTVNDRFASTSSANFNLTITVSNNTPTLGATGPFAFDENISAGTSVVTMSGADVDVGQTLTYSIQSGNTGSMFAINSSTGAITFSGSPNFEALSSYSLVVRVTDNGAGSLFAERTVVVNINDLNETPTLGAAGPFTFDENISAGTAVVTMSGADVDGGQTLTYSIQSGNTGSMFAINSSTGAITFAGSPNFEALSSYSLVVRVTDNGAGSLFAERTVVININDLNESPTIVTNTGASINEGGSVVITTSMLNEGDPDDSGTGLTYTASALTNGHITVNGITQNTFTQADIDAGIVRFVHNGSNTNTASFAISLVDGGENGATPATGTFNLTVIGVNDAPVITGGGGTFSWAENQANGSILTTIITNDPDDVTLTYSFDGTAPSVFSINPANGIITQTSAIDYELVNSYSFTIRVQDPGGLFDTIVVTVMITDVNDDAPAQNTDTQGSGERNTTQSNMSGLPGFLEEQLTRDSSSTIQIIRQNLSDSIKQILADSLLNGSVLGRANFDGFDPNFDQEESIEEPAPDFTNLRQSLEFLSRMEESQREAVHADDAAQEDRQKSLPPDSTNTQFVDVMTYHQDRARQLREALMG